MMMKPILFGSRACQGIAKRTISQVSFAVMTHTRNVVLVVNTDRWRTSTQAIQKKYATVIVMMRWMIWRSNWCGTVVFHIGMVQFNVPEAYGKWWCFSWVANHPFWVFLLFCLVFFRHHPAMMTISSISDTRPWLRVPWWQMAPATRTNINGSPNFLHQRNGQLLFLGNLGMSNSDLDPWDTLTTATSTYDWG